MSRLLLIMKGLAMFTVALALTVMIEERRLNAERSRGAIAALRATNLVAERDSTRDVALANRAIAKFLGDSLRLVERQVLQVAQRRDALDDALGRERRGRYALSVAMQALDRTARAPATNDSANGMRRASFAVRQPPYTVAAEVEMPERPDTLRLSIRVALDPIHMDARLSCSAPDAQGIRSATVVAAAPSWATVRFDRVEQSPELCASPALLHATRSPWQFLRRGLVIGVGRVIGFSGTSWGAFVGIGMSL